MDNKQPQENKMQKLIAILTLSLISLSASAADVTIGFSGGKWLRFTWDKYIYVSNLNADHNAWCSYARQKHLNLYPNTSTSFLNAICTYKGGSPAVNRYHFDMHRNGFNAFSVLKHKSGYQSGTYNNGIVGNLVSSFDEQFGFWVERDRTNKRARVCVGIHRCTAWMYQNSHNLSALNVIKRAKQYGRSINGRKILWVKWNNSLI